jgi:hypothetical protein
MNNHSREIVHTIDSIFNENTCEELCKRSKFIQRSSSKLRGSEFIKTMIIPSMGVSTDSLKGLCKRINQFNSRADLSSQALCERINHVGSVNLMKAVFVKILIHMRTKVKQPCNKLAGFFKSFTRVLLEDSTVCTLNEQLAEKFSGTHRGGRACKSQAKIDVIYDLGAGETIDAKIYKGNEPDQALSGRIIEHIKPGDLIIRDLGYFVLKVLKSIADSQAYFLSRLLPNVKIYLSNENQELLDLSRHIQTHHPQDSIIELSALLGDEKMPCRLILYRLPKEIADKRLMEANKRAKDTGREMSKSKRFFLNFAIFVTNVPQTLLSAELVGTIYRLRWEIELVFKRWKSQLQIDYLKGINPNRIECLIWSRLCSVLITEMIRGHTVTWWAFETELSDIKFIDYLLRGDKLCKAIANDRVEEFYLEMEQDKRRMLLKDKRKRKTLRDRVFTQEAYYGNDLMTS